MPKEYKDISQLFYLMLSWTNIFFSKENNASSILSSIYLVSHVIINGKVQPSVLSVVFDSFIKKKGIPSI